VTTQSSSVIERREYKYLIDPATAAAVRAAIRPFCEVDRFAASSPTRTYTVESLYFDTTDLSLFWANDHEQVDRLKMRVRCYPDAPAAPVFFEVKRRSNDAISKTRGAVGRGIWADLLAEPSAAIPESMDPKDRAAVERFLALARAKHVHPITLVRYAREPYFSRIDDYARVTFDTHIRAHLQDRTSFEVGGRGWRALDDAVTQRTLDSLIVLELKFTNLVPLWMVQIARSLGLVRRAFSKYGTSVRAFHSVPDLRTSRSAGAWR
jgi:VTC domain